MDEIAETPKRSSAGKWIVAVLVVGAVAFLAGYVPGRMATGKAEEGARAAEARLENVRQELAVSKLRGTLGMAMYEANRNNFANAASYASAFFEGLRTTMADAGFASDRRAAFDAILSRRDEISGDLARGDAAVKAKLEGMFVEMGRGVDPALER